MAIVQKVVDLVHASGVDYRLMPGNEMAREREGEETRAQADRILYEWQEYLMQLLMKEGVPADRIIISITGTNIRERIRLPLLAKYPRIVEQIHGPNSPETLERFLDRYPSAELDGDGFDDLAAGHTNSYGFTMPSLEQCGQIRKIMVVRGIRQYSTFKGNIEEHGWQDLTAARWGELRAMAAK